ncbi:NAD-P-binding protein [Trametes elegans]|nr:NAD-P-binding protein [Trametes elegans]
MPAISPPGRVLITGANGYVGCWVVRALLEKGYAVRGVVRTEEKARALEALVRDKHPDRASAFDCVVIPDISVEGVVEPHLGDVEGIVHTATPVTFALEDPEDYIRPAVEGTLGVLQSVAKFKDIKRIVVTSSVGAISETYIEKTRVFTEDDWNDYAVGQARMLGKAASGFIKYDCSKVLSEKAAWDFWEKNKDALSYDLSVVAPSWILGPIPDDPPSPTAFTSPSPKLMWAQLFADPAPLEPSPLCFNYVDIRDVTEMHVRALEREEAGGHRFISSSHVCTWDDWLNAARKLGILPGLTKLHSKTDRGQLPPHPIFSNTKARQLLGIEFKTVPETLQDLAEDFGKRGWLRHLESPSDVGEKV